MAIQIDPNINRDPVPGTVYSHIVPGTANTYDLGSASFEFRDAFFGDDGMIFLGSDQDVVFHHRNDALNADTALTSVLIGTPESQAIAANSLMISNITASGDIAFYVNKGGASQMAIWLDGSSGDTAIMAASGASIDAYIAGTKVLDYATGAFAFQQNTIISSTGSLTLTTPIIASLYQASGGGLISVPASAGVDTVCLLAATQELDNKTLDSSVLKGTLTASGTVTLPAFTAGGDISMAGYYLLPAASGNVLVKAEATNRGLQIVNTFNGAAGVGSQLILDFNRGGAGAVANLDTDFFICSFQGYNDNATPEIVRFAHQRIIIDDASDTTEDAHWEWYAQAAGAENEAMDLTGAGLLWLDVGVNVDNYYQVAGTQVVAAQGAAVADVSDGLLATTITQLNALLARVRTHGLIAT